MASNDEHVSDLRATIDKAKIEARFDEAALGLIDLAEKAETAEERAAAIEEAADLFQDKLDDANQAAVLRRVLVELYEESDNFAKAADVLEQLVDQGSDPVETLEQLAGIYAELEDWEKLVQTYDRLVEKTDESADKIAVYRQRAMIQKEALGRADDALATNEEILALDASDAEALDAVIAGYEDRERWDDLKKLFEEQATNDATERTNWLRRAADAASKTDGGTEEKNRLLAKILDENPSDAGALESLEAQAREDEDWVKVSELLAQRAEATDDLTAKLTLWVEAGNVLATRQADPAAAIPLFEHALRAKKNHLPAIDGLLSALNATEQYELASKVYELKLHLSGGETQEIDARLAMALSLIHISEPHET